MVSKTSLDKARSHLSKHKVVTLKRSKEKIAVYCSSRKAEFKPPRRVCHKVSIKKTHDIASRFLFLKGLVN